MYGDIGRLDELMFISPYPIFVILEISTATGFFPITITCGLRAFLTTDFDRFFRRCINRCGLLIRFIGVN